MQAHAFPYSSHYKHQSSLEIEKLVLGNCHCLSKEAQMQFFCFERFRCRNFERKANEKYCNFISISKNIPTLLSETLLMSMFYFINPVPNHKTHKNKMPFTENKSHANNIAQSQCHTHMCPIFMRKLKNEIENKSNTQNIDYHTRTIAQLLTNKCYQ